MPATTILDAALRDAAAAAGKPTRELLRRAAAGRDAVTYGDADPVITLALVVWPTAELLERIGELDRA